MPAHRDLKAWQEAVNLAEAVHSLVREFPEIEPGGLGSQMERTALSIASNIAQGQGHLSSPDCLRYIGHARGSLAELDTQVILAERFGYGEPQRRGEILKRIDTVVGMLNRLRTTLVARSLTGSEV